MIGRVILMVLQLLLVVDSNSIPQRGQSVFKNVCVCVCV